MHTTLEIGSQNLTELEQNFLAKIKDYGWTGTHVFEDENGPGFSYSTGLFLKFNVPEVIIFGLPAETAHHIMWNIVQKLEKGERFELDTSVPDILKGYNIQFKSVNETNYPNFLGWNRWFYGGNEFEASQVFYPNKEGEFLWEMENKSDFWASQPNLSL